MLSISTEANRARLRIVRNSAYNNADEEKLKANITECFDRRMNVKIVYVEEIERPASGKLKLVVADGC